MNFINRALCSVMRKKGKSFILFTVIFVLGNVIAGAISIQQSTQNVEKNIKKQLGAMATVEIDYENNQEELMKADDGIAPLKVDLIKKIGESPYVKYYDYNAGAWIQTKNLKSITNDSEQMAGIEGFSLKGSTYPKILDVQENKIKLVDGKVFTQEEIDNGKNVGLISSKVADENGLSVGDQMVMDSRGIDYTGTYTGTDGTEKELFKLDIPIKIIGIFEPTKVEMEEKNDKQTLTQQFMSVQQFNTIYVPNKTVIEINNNYNEKMKKEAPDSEYVKFIEKENSEYYTPIYVLKSSDDVEAFRQETDPLLPELYTVIASTDQYEKVGSSMKKMSKISGYVVLIAVIATLLIITLVVLLFMRERKYELGIYLSLGDKRSRVIGQIVIEMFLISGVALIVSLVTGNFLGEIVSEALLGSDILSSANNQLDMSMMMDTFSNVNVTSDDLIKAYEVKFSMGYIVTYLVVGLGTVLLSAILPLTYILRLNPKKIMM